MGVLHGSIAMYYYSVECFNEYCDRTFFVLCNNPEFCLSLEGGNMEMVLLEMDIQFERADKGLGLSIAGGLGSTPYKNNDEGIFISRVTPMGPADLAGLRKDDKVRNKL